jgi:hypothetical protein
MLSRLRLWHVIRDDRVLGPTSHFCYHWGSTCTPIMFVLAPLFVNSHRLHQALWHFVGWVSVHGTLSYLWISLRYCQHYRDDKVLGPTFYFCYHWGSTCTPIMFVLAQLFVNSHRSHQALWHFVGWVSGHRTLYYLWISLRHRQHYRDEKVLGPTFHFCYHWGSLTFPSIWERYC